MPVILPETLEFTLPLDCGPGPMKVQAVELRVIVCSGWLGVTRTGGPGVPCKSTTGFWAFARKAEPRKAAMPNRERRPGSDLDDPQANITTPRKRTWRIPLQCNPLPNAAQILAGWMARILTSSGWECQNKDP